MHKKWADAEKIYAGVAESYADTAVAPKRSTGAAFVITKRQMITPCWARQASSWERNILTMSGP